MRKLLLGIIIFCLSSSAFAALPFVTEDQFSDWVMDYYHNPKPELAHEVIEFYAQSTMFIDHPSTRDMVSIFFAYIYKAHPELLTTDFEKFSVSKSENARIVFLNILWIVDTEESHALLQRAGKEWTNSFVREFLDFAKDNIPPLPLAVKPLTPSDLDMLWSIYFATGDELAIQQIIAVLDYKSTKDVDNALLIGAAKWSLTGNAQKDPFILTICENALKQAKGKTKLALQEIIKKCKEEKK